MNASAATADTPLRQAWLHVDLAWRLGSFATNRHE
jgi:hypothetical protein